MANKKSKNVSKIIKNGTLIITNDKFFYGTDGKSNKTRMGVVLDSNRKDQLGIGKYTTSEKGLNFVNDKGFISINPNYYTLDNEGKPIIYGEKFKPQNKRRLSKQEVNNAKKLIFKESPYAKKNKENARRLKHR